MTIPDEFAEFGFNPEDEWPHPCGNIPIKFIEEESDGKRTAFMMWGLRQGSHYPPEKHSHGHVLQIKHGCGIISIAGEELPYKSGDSFTIAGDVPHGFIQVDSTTLVAQFGLPRQQ